MAGQNATEQIKDLYAAFNRRDAEFVIEKMSPEVRWPRAFEGDFVSGQAAVKEYWKHQWREIDPTVEPESITELDDGRFDVAVRQVVKNLEGEVLADDVVHHLYKFDGGLIVSMEVGTPRIDLGLGR